MLTINPHIFVGHPVLAPYCCCPSFMPIHLTRKLMKTNFSSYTNCGSPQHNNSSPFQFHTPLTVSTQNIRRLRSRDLRPLQNLYYSWSTKQQALLKLATKWQALLQLGHEATSFITTGSEATSFSHLSTSVYFSWPWLSEQGGHRCVWIEQLKRLWSNDNSADNLL